MSIIADDIETAIEAQTTGAFSIAYGSPTISLSSASAQILGYRDYGATLDLDLAFTNESLELLIGSKT